MLGNSYTQPGAAGAVGLGVSTGNKSADTRFKNNQAVAQGLVPAVNNGSPIKRVSASGQGPKGYNQNTPMPTGNQQSMVPAPNMMGNVSGGALPQVNAPAQSQVQPEDLALEYFLSSPEIQEALSKEKLKQYFKGNNPEGAEGTVARDVVQSVISRVTS